MWQEWRKGDVCIRFLVGKRDGKIPLGRPRLRWEDNIKWIFRKLEGVVGTGWG